jgi:hypothetical protein
MFIVQYSVCVSTVVSVVPVSALYHNRYINHAVMIGSKLSLILCQQTMQLR